MECANILTVCSTLNIKPVWILLYWPNHNVQHICTHTGVKEHSFSVCGKVHSGVPFRSGSGWFLTALSLMDSVVHSANSEPYVYIPWSIMNRKQLLQVLFALLCYWLSSYHDEIMSLQLCGVWQESVKKQTACENELWGKETKVEERVGVKSWAWKTSRTNEKERWKKEAGTLLRAPREEAECGGAVKRSGALNNKAPPWHKLKSKQLCPKHVGIISDLDTALSRCRQLAEELQTGGLGASVTTTSHRAMWLPIRLRSACRTRKSHSTDFICNCFILQNSIIHICLFRQNSCSVIVNWYCRKTVIVCFMSCELKQGQCLFVFTLHVITEAEILLWL